MLKKTDKEAAKPPEVGVRFVVIDGEAVITTCSLQAEDVIRLRDVTGVHTSALRFLPATNGPANGPLENGPSVEMPVTVCVYTLPVPAVLQAAPPGDRKSVV